MNIEDKRTILKQYKNKYSNISNALKKDKRTILKQYGVLKNEDEYAFRYLDCYKIREVAEKMNVSEDTVKRKQKKGLELIEL